MEWMVDQWRAVELVIQASEKMNLFISVQSGRIRILGRQDVGEIRGGKGFDDNRKWGTSAARSL